MANVDIKFIAEKSGCSIATVSRVINRSKPVSEHLQKKCWIQLRSIIIIRVCMHDIWQKRNPGYLDLL